MSFPARIRRRHMIALAAFGLVAAAVVAGLGTFASFTSSASQSITISSGTVTIALGATGASTNRLNVNATAIVPGDTMQRSADVIVSGSSDLGSIKLTTTASPSSLLDTDATNGLQITVDKCSTAWSESGTSPAFTYTCGGTTTNVLSSQAVIGANISLPGVSTTAGATTHLRVTLTLPSTAGNTFQGLSSTISCAFTGTQRAATNE